MNSDTETNMKKEDRNIQNLRHLYEQYGFVHYKMNKFEEYDLYVANKDFLAGDSIITFTDTNGKLLALKPDVTLSIVKNYRDAADTVQKVYYNENIYRTSKSTKTYKELMQMGLECMGDLDLYHISEVLILAAKSLEILSDRYILDLSHMGIIQGFLEEVKLRPKHEEKFLTLLREKNAHGIRALFDSLKIDEELREAAILLATTYGSMDTVLKTLESISLNDTMDQAIEDLSEICQILEEQGFDNVHLDFSIAGDMNYYNGIVFQGFIEGIPDSVLSGGQYDMLMHKMGRKSGSIGFAVYLDVLEQLSCHTAEYDVDTLILYDDKTDLKELMKKVNDMTQNGTSVTAQKQIPSKLRYRHILNLSGKGRENND